MQVIIENNTTHFRQYYDEVEVKNGKIYMETELDMTGLQDGEYTLYLLNNVNQLISKDLVRIGDYQNENKKITKFIQYGRK